jgi:hypothetical protein
MVYSHKKYGRETDHQIAALNNEGVGISSISRILEEDPKPDVNVAEKNLY